MKTSTFFKILNKKIEKYDKIATNPFISSQKLILIWVEEEKETQEDQNIDKKY